MEASFNCEANIPTFCANNLSVSIGLAYFGKEPFLLSSSCILEIKCFILNPKRFTLYYSRVEDEGAKKLPNYKLNNGKLYLNQ